MGVSFDLLYWMQMGMASFDCNLESMLAYSCDVEQSSCETAALQQRYVIANLGKYTAHVIAGYGRRVSIEQTILPRSIIIVMGSFVMFLA